MIYTQNDYEMSGVASHSGLPSRSVVKVKLPGFRYGNGKVQKAQVEIQD